VNSHPFNRHACLPWSGNGGEKVLAKPPRKFDYPLLGAGAMFTPYTAEVTCQAT
jgi:hypothetical protein